MKKDFSRKIYKISGQSFFPKKNIQKKSKKIFFEKIIFRKKFTKILKIQNFFKKKNFARNDSIRDLEHKNTNDEASKKCFKGLPKRNNETPFQ